MDMVKEFLQSPPPPSALFNAYASLSGTVMLLQSSPNPIPLPIRTFLWSKIRQHFLRFQTLSTTTVVVDEFWGVERNLLYDAVKVYLPTKISPVSLPRVKMGKVLSQRNISAALPEGEQILDTFRSVQVTWRFVCSEAPTKNYVGDGSNCFTYSNENRYFELSFDSKHKQEIISSYLMHVMVVSEYLTQQDRQLKIYSCNKDNNSYGSCKNYAYLHHPASFDTIALEPELKQLIVDDLDRFLAGKEYYKRIGKAWKRGYLLYGPPGTGKSSLVVAIAKYLKYDVYDLELSSIRSNSQLRNIFLSMASKSVLVIEDIDCFEEVHARSETLEVPQMEDSIKNKRTSCTLSGILNAIDGLWSGCGEERIIIFTTNHKEKIDPALLRPGRMDMHIELSYLMPSAFPVLAYNYLAVRDGDHPLLEQIPILLESADVTPASVAEELLRSKDTDIALRGVVDLLKRKRMEFEEDKLATPGDLKKIKLL